MMGVKAEDDDGYGGRSIITPQHQPPSPSPPPRETEVPLMLHLERGEGPPPPECPVLARFSSADDDPPIVVGPAASSSSLCRCPVPSLLVTTADPRCPGPKPRRTSVRDIPAWGLRRPPVRLSFPSESDYERHYRDLRGMHHGRRKYGKLVLWLHGLDPARLGDGDDLAEKYRELRRRGGAAPKAALVKGAGEGGKVYLEPMEPDGPDEAPYLRLVFVGGDSAAECHGCAQPAEAEKAEADARRRRHAAAAAAGSPERHRHPRPHSHPRLSGPPAANPPSPSASSAMSPRRRSPASASTPPRPLPVVAAAASSSASAIVGNNILSRLLDRHSRWPFGGLAELLHNSADADATHVKVSAFPSLPPSAVSSSSAAGAGAGASAFTDPFDPTFALRIDDDGRGMDHDDMVRMMRIGADSSIGRSDKLGKIGGYGVGFKAGSLATARTAVVLSACLAKRTVSVGLLSNEPYEERQEQPHVGLVATQSLDTAMVDEATTTVEGMEELKGLIEKLNPRLNRDMIGIWSGQMAMTGKSGTTVFLCDVRRNPDRPDRMIYEFMGDFDGNPDLRFLAPGSDSRPFDEFNGRYDGQVAPMDHSFRAYLGLMFKNRTPKISLFGVDVEQHDLSSELVDSRKIELGHGVTADVGLHPPSASLSLSGAMLYCEGVLVESYARREFEIAPEDDNRNFGALLIADLPKSTSEARTVHDGGFKPKDDKLSFDWAGKREFKRRIKAEFVRYEDEAEAERDRKNPVRTALRGLVVAVREKIERMYGYSGGSAAGSMVGLVRLPIREPGEVYGGGSDKKGSGTHQSYFQAVEDPISLHELSEHIEEGRYAGDGGLSQFKKDLKRIFRNIRHWHSQCRWHPDNNVDDIALLSNAEDGEASAKPFRTDMQVYTIRAICKHLDIPDEFHSVMVEGNDDYGDIDEDSEFSVGTTILLPHHLDVQAFKDAEELGKFALSQLREAKRTLERADRARKQGPRDCWLQCDNRACRKWRRVTEAYQSRYTGIDAHWTCDADGSPVAGCHVPEDRRADDEVVVRDDAASASAASASAASHPTADDSGGGSALADTEDEDDERSLSPRRTSSSPKPKKRARGPRKKKSLKSLKRPHGSENEGDGDDEPDRRGERTADQKKKKKKKRGRISSSVDM